MQTAFKLLSLVVLVSSFSAWGMVEVGDTLPNLSWTDSENKVVTLDELKGGVTVLLYNGGFCAPCNEEFRQLIPRVKEFDGKPVRFVSLSVAGWSSSSPPNAKFLNEWKARHKIPFLVAQ